MALIFSLKGDTKSALKFYESEIALKKQLFGSEHLSLAESYYNLSNVYLLETKFEKMIEIL